MSKHGFTLVEATVVIALGMVVATVAIFGFAEVVERMRYDAAIRHVLSDLREARSRAIATGWEYRVVGYDASESGERKNQYRVLARRSTAAWPAEESSVFTSETRAAGPWVDVAGDHPGTYLDSAATRFVLTFDSRGAAATDEFNPLRLVGPDGLESTFNVSAVGGISVE